MKIRVNVSGKDFDVEIEDLSSRPVIAIIDGKRFEVWPESEQDSAGEEGKSYSACIQHAYPAAGKIRTTPVFLNRVIRRYKSANSRSDSIYQS